MGLSGQSLAREVRKGPSEQAGEREPHHRHGGHRSPKRHRGPRRGGEGEAGEGGRERHVGAAQARAGNAAHAGPAEIANRASLDSRRLDFDEIPIIDLSPMFGSQRRAREECAGALRRACTMPATRC